MSAIYPYHHIIEKNEVEPDGYVSCLTYLLWTRSAAQEHSAKQGWTPEKYIEIGAAWILETSADVAVRNGAEALASGKRAYELTKQSGRYDLLDTLAAAYAENGRFKKAIEWQLHNRLELYKSRKSYRETSSE